MYQVITPRPKGRGKRIIHTYTFRFYPAGNYYDIEIVEMPSYGKRISNLSITHRIPVNRKYFVGWKICFGTPEVVDTLDKADKWSKVWANNTSKYILIGKPFPNDKN